MPLTCTCPDDYDLELIYEPPHDFSPFPLRRGRRCESCKTMIRPGDECVEFKQFRAARDDVEIAIYGEDGCPVPLASMFLCEECGGLWFAFEERGFCGVDPWEDMKAMARRLSKWENTSRSR